MTARNPISGARPSRRWIALAGLAWIATVMLRPLPAQDIDPESRPVQAPGSRPILASHPSGPIRTTLDLVIHDSDPVLQGHGPSKTIQYETRSGGTLIVYALSDSMDLFLLATRERTGDAGTDGAPASAASTFEDENGGGYPTPYLQLDTRQGWTWKITVACSTTPPASRPDSRPSAVASAGPARLHLLEVPESDATLALAREAATAHEEVKRLAVAGRFEDAREELKDVVDRLLGLGADHASMALDRSLMKAGSDAGALGDLETARRCLLWSTEFRDSVGPGDQPDLQRARLILAHTTYALGDLAATRALEEKVLEVFTRTLPDDHRDLQAARLGLASTMGTLGDLVAARALQEKVLDVCTRTLPDDHRELQAARMGLGRTTYAQGDLAASRKLFERVFEVRSRTLPDDHPDLQATRQCLAGVVSALGDPAAARKLLEKVLEVRTRTLPEDHPDLQQTRLNFAATLYLLGDIVRARTLFEKVLEVFSRILPDDHPDLQLARLNLASAVMSLGDPESARKLLEKVLEVDARTLPDDHPDLQTARANLAVILKALDDREGARKLEEKVLEVLSRTLPDDHPDLQAARGNLAVTIESLGDFQGAKVLFEKALHGFTRVLPDDHPDLQAARGNLAVNIEALGDLEGARRLFEKVVQVFSRTLPDDHPDLQKARGNLALNLCQSSEWSGMQDVITNMLRGARGSGGLVARTESPREVVTRQSADDRSLDQAISLSAIAAPPEIASKLLAEVYWTVEQRRARFLVASRLRHLVAGAAISGQVDALRARARATTAEIARYAARGASEDLARSVRERDAAEREMIGLLRGVPGAARLASEPTAAALAARLGSRDALVAYSRFDVGRLTGAGSSSAWIVTPSYFAWVIRPGPVLVRVDLGDAAAVDRAIERYRASIGAPAERGGETENLPSLKPRECGARLRALIFDPLRKALGDAANVTVAWSHALHQVPLDALPIDEGVLGDIVHFHVRSSLQEILHDVERPGASPGFLGLGGIDYDAATEASGKTDETSAPAIALARNPHGNVFADLPQTAAEVEAIGGYFKKAFKDAAPPLILEEEAATKPAFLERAPTVRYLHLATHGFFAPDSVPCITDPKPIDPRLGLMHTSDSRQVVIGLSPMILCGLALAGANRPADERGKVEGCITAEEISALDLSGCELCVLSACDTSVGIQRAGMGIASLQTALHAAGVRTAITSLWKVPDQATRELMTDFYRRMWIEKKPKWQALWEAKVRLRDMLDENGRPKYTLKYWAAWVLTGEPD